MSNLLKEESFEEADNFFSSMERSGCAPDSRLLNMIIRILLEKGEIAKAGIYMSKIDEKDMSFEASTASLMISLFSKKGKYQEHMKLLPVKYQFFRE